MEIYLVGGAVRDQLLDLTVKEKDWLVVGATPAQMIAQGFRPVGKDFPVFLHPKTQEEYALARTERKTAPGYKGFHFYADESVTLAQDLRRRDLTINAIAIDAEGRLVDPLNGQQDIKRRLLRHVSDAFVEDPVRILRVARFLARFAYLDFTIAKSTMQLMQAMVSAGETKHLVPERVWQECVKALGEKNPEYFWLTLNQCGALADIFGEYSEVTFDKSLDNLVAVAKTISKPLRFAAMLYALSANEVEAICERLSVPNTYRELAQHLNQFAADLINVRHLDAATVLRLVQQLDVRRKKERFNLLLFGAKLLLHSVNDTAIDVFWENVVEKCDEVNPQYFIQQGLEKAALGQAIQQQRLENIESLINQQSKQNDRV